MYRDDTPGLLVIRMFVAQHDNPHRGRPVRLYSYPCVYGDAPGIAKQWREANGDWARAAYNNPLDIRFELGSVQIE